MEILGPVIIGFVVILAILIVKGKVRHEPDYKIHALPVTFFAGIGFLETLVFCGSFLAAILGAVVLGCFSLGVFVYHEGMLHAKYGINSSDQSLNLYTGGRSKANPSSQNESTIIDGRGPSR